jgi:hypothetical protein
MLLYLSYRETGRGEGTSLKTELIFVLLTLLIYPAIGSIEMIPNGPHIVSINLGDMKYKLEVPNYIEDRYYVDIYANDDLIGEILTADNIMKGEGERYTVSDLSDELYNCLLGYSENPEINPNVLNGIDGYIGYGIDAKNPLIVVWGIITPHKVFENGTIDGYTMAMMRTSDETFNKRAVKSVKLMR